MKLPPRLFWLLSRLAVATYGRLPVFGMLRSSTAIVVRNGDYLVIRRSDGLGLAFPGGMAWPWETDDQAVRRELREETGLESNDARLLFRYRDRHYIPGHISVFAVRAAGDLRASWEGSPLFLPLAEIRPRVFASHQAIVAFLSERGPAAHP